MARQAARSAAPRDAQQAASPRKRLLFAILVLGLMLGLCAPFFVDLIARNAPQPANGQVSYRGWGPLDAPVELGGSWRLDWAGAPATSVAVPVPGGWRGIALPDGRTLPESGIGSYQLTLRDLPAGRYTLHIPILFGATRVFLDGRLVGARGRIGSDAASTRYDVRSYDIPIEADGDPLALRVDFAAFLHRDSGFGDAPVLGLVQPMQTWTALEWAKDLLFHTSLILLAAISFVAFLFRRQDRASLYLSLAALCVIPGTAVLSYDNLLLIVLPGIGFPAMLAAQYLCTDLAIMFFLGYAYALYGEEAPKRLVWSLQGAMAGFIVGQAAAFLLGGTRTASDVALFWPAVSTLIFIGIIAIVLRAALRGKDGAVVFLLGIVVFTLFFFNAALSWSGLVPARLLFGTNTLPLGMLMLLFSHFVVVAERWSLAILSAEQMTADLQELIDVSSAITSEIKLETLLGRIVETTSRILNADRSSLLLHDARTGELWSLVAEGVEARQIRFDAREGLAGAAFASGETLNIRDAYAEPRFNREVDLSTGYRTASILTMPVVARDGRRLGVMQALNRRDGRPFSDGDTKRMRAFAAQAAIAIDNATLFREVVSSRNYNESILRSMASGVVTLDSGAIITKLNAAACRMLGVEAEQLEGRDAREVLGLTNPWLIAEIEAVSATGEPKLLLDVDLQTARTDPMSANITIVPLLSGGEPVGLLTLIEDISEGKRVRGAMRRFMTQKVVDQVLARQDDLLFGTACEASILFADIRNFTAMSEALSPRETVDMLNEAFTDLFEAVAGSDGVLDKFIGDAIMAVYGAPLSSGRDPENAAESAITMLRMLSELNRRRAAREQPPLQIGIGIATGEVVAGTIGSPKRMDYTVIGDSVNLAARLQELTKSYGVAIIVCERTAAALRGRHRLRELDLIRVRGRSRPAKIFEIVVPSGTDEVMTARAAAAYAQGRRHVAVRDWSAATASFAQALAYRPDDGPARLMQARVRQLQERPPGADWDGVWHDAGPA